MSLLYSLGMLKEDGCASGSIQNCFAVILDGGLIGWLPKDDAANAVASFRQLKCKSILPEEMEIAFIPQNFATRQYPGLYIFVTTGGRMSRPVNNLRTGSIEWIGILEQLHLHICMKKEDIVENETTHIELSEQNFLSEVAAMTPFSDHNQSPRNLYQCQVNKMFLKLFSHIQRFSFATSLQLSDQVLYKKPVEKVESTCSKSSKNCCITNVDIQKSFSYILRMISCSITWFYLNWKASVCLEISGLAFRNFILLCR